MAQRPFYFSDALMHRLENIILASRPRLYIVDKKGKLVDKSRVVFFLNECERVLDGWLCNYPTQRPRNTKRDAASLRALRKKADEFRRTLLLLTPAAEFSLNAASFIREGKGCSQEQMRSKRVVREYFVTDLIYDIDLCLDPFLAPLHLRRTEDFTTAIVRAYVTAFRKMPSANTSGVFSRFLRELAESKEVSAGGKITVGRLLIEKAIVANSAWLDDLVSYNEGMGSYS